MILLLVFMTLLFLRKSYIPFYQSLNFVLSLSNYSGSGTMLFGITAYSLVFIITGTYATDITSSNCSIVSSEILFMIYKDPSLSNSTSMLSVLLELVLVLLCGLHHMCFIYHLSVALSNFVHRLLHYTSLVRWACQCFTKCYNLSSELRLYLGKDLRREKGRCISGKA